MECIWNDTDREHPKYSENKLTRGIFCLKSTFSTTIPYGAAWDSTRVFAVKARRRAAWFTTRTTFDC